MLYKDFEELIIFWRNSVASEKQLQRNMLETWYEQYFQYYSKDRLKKVILFLSENGIEVTLQKILVASKEMFGYLLHEEIEKAKKIKEYKKLKKDFSELPMPCMEAVEYLKKQKV